MDALREIFRPLPSGVLLVLLGACVPVAVAWFVWNRILALAWLAKCHNLAVRPVAAVGKLWYNIGHEH